MARFAPFHRTTEPLTKLLPFTVSVNPAPPTFADVGAMLAVVGTGAKPVGRTTCMNDATEGTPRELMTNSMYGPAGTAFTFAGNVTLRPPLVRSNTRFAKRWLMLTW